MSANLSLMTPERFRQITDLFHAALERPAAERLTLVRHESAGDDELRGEVCAMLAAHEAGGVDVPRMSIPADGLVAGALLGRYEVRGLIADGGMGQVYRARDARLDRDVAVKVLPPEYAEDLVRLRRFEQEARASGALTHPNLLTVYDVGTHQGRPYLVTELLDGETLRERAARGPMSTVRACEIAADLARGLAAAHGRGVVHRDLKPENVMITRDARVKILDFGVAKLRAADVGDTRAPVASVPETESGIIVGTVGYMAPEQIRGLESDSRADIFALGAVLFELLTGRQAFEGASRAATLESTLRDDPLSSERSAKNWPPAVHRIVQRCLEKEADARFQSAADLAFALETIIGSLGTSADDRSGARRYVPTISIAAALLLGVGAVGMTLWRAPDSPPTSDPLVRFSIPVGSRVRFTDSAAITSDGTTIVYSASEGLKQSQQLFAHRIDQIAAVTLPGTERATSPFISPDGESVAFWADNQLKRTRLDGTASPAIICTVESFLGGTWTNDGTIVFGSTKNGLQRVDAGGGLPQPLSVLDRDQSEFDHHAPAMLPGGRALLVTVHEGERKFRVDVLLLDTGARRTVVEDGFDARYLPTGHIVYAAGTTLFAAPFDLARLERSGPAVRLQDGVSTDRREGHARFAVSDTGTLVYLPLVPQARRTIAWVDRAGQVTPLPLEPRTYWAPRLSPDDRRFAVVVEDQGAFHIWIYRLDNGTFSPLTSEGRNWSPVWSRDSSHLIYVSERNGQWQLIRDRLDGQAIPEVLLTSADRELEPGAVSADGRSLVYVKRSPGGDAELHLLDTTRRQTTAIDGLPDRVAMPVASPNGRWLGFTGWRRGSGPPSVFVRRFGEPGPVRQLVEGAGYTAWNRMGNMLYFRSRRGGAQGSPEDGIFELPFDPLRGVAMGPERQLFRTAFADSLGVPGFDVSADGRFLLVQSDGAPELLPRDPRVVLHVDDHLRQRARSAAR
jgi:serine/threonine protein kinase